MELVDLYDENRSLWAEWGSAMHPRSPVNTAWWSMSVYLTAGDGC